MLVDVIGVSLVAGAQRRRPVQDQALLGAASAAGLAAVDTLYVLERRISPISSMPRWRVIVVRWIAAVRRGHLGVAIPSDDQLQDRQRPRAAAAGGAVRAGKAPEPCLPPPSKRALRKDVRPAAWER
jgi:hypothetical protein